MTKPPDTHSVICFGEVLWDSLPQGLFPGGAPVNVAYHLQQLGLRAIPVTAVGNDFLGQDLQRRLRRWGLDPRYVATVGERQTGVVLVELNEEGVPSYRIVEDVAWDWIPLPEELQEEASTASALVFGTLAQRASHNRRQLERLVEWTPHAWKVYDVNLRPPFDSTDLVMRLTRHADLIKLNDDEVRQLTDSHDTEASLAEAARRLAGETGCRRICVTAGADGAGLLWDDQWHWTPGQSIRVQDTVGAGDAFLAGLVHACLQGKQPSESLERATRLGEFIASCHGATPSYTVDSDGRPVKG